MTRTSMKLLVPLLLVSSTFAYSDFEEAMRADEDQVFVPEGRASPLSPVVGQFGGLGLQGGITIEQFVKELKKRKEAAEKKQQKAVAPSKKGGKGERKEKQTSEVKTKPNLKSSQKRPAKTGPAKGKARPSKKRPSNSRPSKKRPAKKSPAKKSPAKASPAKTRPANVKPKKSKPVLKQPVDKSKSKQRKQKQFEKRKKASIRKKQEPKTPLIKPVIKSAPAAVPRPAKTKPSTIRKPVQKTKKKVAKTESKEDDDPFNFGTSSAQEHSDHHIHHHDHLEAHKHHHKHKEEHAHDHAHANDHVHNHKHTHNHVHNHIHKHNEAHEHTAEHAHTEKHTHKHLEYVDQGGWRRREDQVAPGQFDGLELEEPQELVLQEREGRQERPLDNVKSELQNFIRSYRAHSSDAPTLAPSSGLAALEAHGGLQALEAHVPEEAGQDFSFLEDQDHYGFPPIEEQGDTLPDDFRLHEEPHHGPLSASPLEAASPHPVEVEEISYSEYLRLQEKGPVFEEEVEDYSEYAEEDEGDFGEEFSYGEDYGPASGGLQGYGGDYGADTGDLQGYEQDYGGAAGDYGGAAGDYRGYQQEDQVGFGSSDHVVVPEYPGDWVDMDLDLQYDLGPEYLDYQELARVANYTARSFSGASNLLEGRSLPDSPEGRSLPIYTEYETSEEDYQTAPEGRSLPTYIDYEASAEDYQASPEGRSLPIYTDYEVSPEDRNILENEPSLDVRSLSSYTDYEVSAKDRNLPSYTDYDASIEDGSFQGFAESTEAGRQEFGGDREVPQYDTDDGMTVLDGVDEEDYNEYMDFLEKEMFLNNISDEDLDEERHLEGVHEDYEEFHPLDSAPFLLQELEGEKGSL